MDNISFAQRMVGAIILLSLAIIFVPMILEPEDEISETIKGTNIPSMPDNVATIVFQMDNEGVFKSLEDQVSKGEELSIRKALESDQRVLPENASTKDQNDVEKEIEKKTLSTNITEGGAITWMVQLGTFGEKANATKLRDKLRKQGFSAYLRERRGANSTIWQVRVGPELSAKKASDLKVRLEKFTGLQALVIRHP